MTKLLLRLLFIFLLAVAQVMATRVDDRVIFDIILNIIIVAGKDDSLCRPTSPIIHNSGSSMAQQRLARWTPEETHNHIERDDPDQEYMQKRTVQRSLSNFWPQDPQSQCLWNRGTSSECSLCLGETISLVSRTA